jgi:hypothetical protein
MRMIKCDIKHSDDIGYVWVCPKCFRHCPVTESTPLHQMNLKMLDVCIGLFARGFFPTGNYNFTCLKSQKSPYF